VFNRFLFFDLYHAHLSHPPEAQNAFPEAFLPHISTHIDVQMVLMGCRLDVVGLFAIISL
jgi:hypothetical protein